MDALPKSGLLRFVTCDGAGSPCYSALDSLFAEALHAPATRRLLCLTVKKTTTYRDLVDELIEMPRLRDALGLDSLPALWTRYTAFTRFERAVWRVVLNVSVAELPVNGVTGIDASGFERAHASTHYTKRANLTIQQLKTTLLVDTATNAVFVIHLTTTRKTRYADCATGGETDRKFHRGVDRRQGV